MKKDIKLCLPVIFVLFAFFIVFALFRFTGLYMYNKKLQSYPVCEKGVTDTCKIFNTYRRRWELLEKED